MGQYYTIDEPVSLNTYQEVLMYINDHDMDFEEFLLFALDAIDYYEFASELWFGKDKVLR